HVSATPGPFDDAWGGLYYDADTETVTAKATGSGLPAGETVTITHSGTVDSRTSLSANNVTTIDNTVVPQGDVPECTSDEDCTTDNPVAPHLTLIKNVVNGSTGQASSSDWQL